MPGKKNLLGKKFSRLLVTKEIPERTADRKVRWRCLCDCGKTTSVEGKKLLNGNTRSCGCLRIEMQEAKRCLEPWKVELSRFKTEARCRGHNCVFSPAEFGVLITQSCHYCGTAPVRTPRSALMRTQRFLIHGIDRVDSSKGYTLDNSVTCCTRCNHAKLDAPVSLFYSDTLQRATHMLTTGLINLSEMPEEVSALISALEGQGLLPSNYYPNQPRETESMAPPPALL